MEDSTKEVVKRQTGSSGIRSVLIVAPWGNPFSWMCVEYDYCDEGRCLSRPALGKSSLEALVELYDNVLGLNTYVLIFVLDTLATAPSPSGCNIPGPCGCTTAYNGIVSCVEARVRSWIDACSGCGASTTLSALQKNGRVIVEVLPGYGSFGGCRFDTAAGNLMQSFKAEVLHVVLREMLKIKPDIVVLDLTHGINYMPSLSLEAVKTAVALYVVATRHSVKLKVVNSEPLPIPVPHTTTPHLTIHKVMEYTLHPREVLRETARKALNLQKLHETLWATASVMQNLGPALTHINNMLGLTRYAKLVSTTILYSLPLTLVYAACEVINHATQANIKSFTLSLSGSIDNVLRAARTHTAQVQGNSIVHSITFKPDGVEKAYAAAAILDYAMNIVNINCSNLHNNGVGIDTLEKIANDITGYMEVSKMLVDQELSNIKCLAELLKKGLYTCPRGTLEYVQILGLDKWPNINCGGLANLRNFYAHIGLERNTIELKMNTTTGEIYIRYRKNCWNEIKSRIV